MIDNFTSVFPGFNLGLLFSAHIVPDIKNVFVMGFVWLLFAVYLYYSKRDLRMSLLIVAGLVIAAVVGNEIIRPILFHYRDVLDQSFLRIYLPEIDNHNFPAGYLMMSASSIYLLWYSDRNLGKVALGIGIFMAIVNMRILFSYTVDFFFGIIFGLLVGGFLAIFYERKEEEELELEELEDRFHF